MSPSSHIVSRAICVVVLLELQKADRAVLEGRRLIENQKAIMEWLANYGHDTTDAQILLKTFLQTQALHEEHADRLRPWKLNESGAHAW